MNWIHDELEQYAALNNIQSPDLDAAAKICEGIFYDRDDCDRLGIDYNRMNLQDRQKVYRSVLQNKARRGCDRK